MTLEEEDIVKILMVIFNPFARNTFWNLVRVEQISLVYYKNVITFRQNDSKNWVNGTSNMMVAVKLIKNNICKEEETNFQEDWKYSLGAYGKRFLFANMYV